MNVCEPWLPAKTAGEIVADAKQTLSVANIFFANFFKKQSLALDTLIWLYGLDNFYTNNLNKFDTKLCKKKLGV